MSKLWLVFPIIVAFFYGLAASHYKIFPYPQLVTLKQQIFPPHATQRPSYSDYYAQKKSLFDADIRNDYDVVFVGDSLTDDADWQILFPDLRSTNHGVQGDNTKGLLGRLDSIDATGASRIALMIGLNDIRRGYEVTYIVENYQKIIDALSVNNRVVYLQSCLYVGVNLAGLNVKIKALNMQLKEIANRFDNVHYVDLNRKLAPSSILDAAYTYDGAHLTGEGYKAWQQALAPYLVSTTNQL